MIKLTQVGVESTTSIEQYVNPDNIERILERKSLSPSGTGCTIVFVSGADIDYIETIDEVFHRICAVHQWL